MTPARIHATQVGSEYENATLGLALAFKAELERFDAWKKLAQTLGTNHPDTVAERQHWERQAERREELARQAARTFEAFAQALRAVEQECRT